MTYKPMNEDPKEDLDTSVPFVTRSVWVQNHVVTIDCIMHYATQQIVTQEKWYLTH